MQQKNFQHMRAERVCHTSIRGRNNQLSICQPSIWSTVVVPRKREALALVGRFLIMFNSKKMCQLDCEIAVNIARYALTVI